MSLTDKIAEKIAGAFGWLLLRELRRIAVAIETSVDSTRELAGFNPVFAKQSPTATIDQMIRDEQGDAAETFASEFPPEGTGDYLRLEMLEALAHQNHIQITTETDLVTLGKEKGWLNEVGELVMLPKGIDQ